MKKSSILLSLLAVLGLSACDFEMPSLVNSQRPGATGGYRSTAINTSQRLPARKLAQSDSLVLAKKQGSRFRVDTAMVLGVITQESAFNVNAVSHAGAQGLMQIMPGTVAYINQKGVVRVSDPFSAEQNSAAGTWYLRHLYDQLEGVNTGHRWRFALGSYNGGIGRVSSAIKKVQAATGKAKSEVSWGDIATYLPKETQNYVPSVVSHTAYYRTQMANR